MRPEGAETINDELSTDITGPNKNLIKRYWVILQALSSKYQMKTTNFKEYCTDKLLVEEYGWFYMPTPVHKILIIGTKVITSKNFNSPIGELSEEAQEALKTVSGVSHRKNVMTRHK